MRGSMKTSYQAASRSGSMSGGGAAWVRDRLYVLAVRNLRSEFPVSGREGRARCFDHALGFSFRQVLTATDECDRNVGARRARTWPAHFDVDSRGLQHLYISRIGVAVHEQLDETR